MSSVGFNIDRITTQYTPKCVENCSDSKVSIIVYITFTKFSVTSVITLKTAYFLNSRLIILLWTGLYEIVTVCAHGEQQKLFVKLIRFKNS